MKKIFALLLLCLAGITASAQCTGSDAFTGTGALGSPNWLQTTVTSGSDGWTGVPFTIAPLSQASNVVAPPTATQGMVVWNNSSCVLPADQTSQITLTSYTLPGSYTGPGVRGTAAGNGYYWNLSQGGIFKQEHYITTSQVAEYCNSLTVAPTLGHTYQLVARGNTFYGYDNGALACQGMDASYPTGGQPYFIVDRNRYTGDWSSTTSYAVGDIVSSGGELYSSIFGGLNIAVTDANNWTDKGSEATGLDSVGSFVAGYSTLAAPVIEPYVTGTYNFSPVITFTNPTAAVMCLTQDGSTPTATGGVCGNGQQIANGASITVTTNSTIQVLATKALLANSPITSATYTIRTGPAITWYVRPDGGTRYSSNITTGQCNGMVDAAYSGSGTNQPCAFNDFRMLFQDGSYTDGSAFPGWGWIGAGGDTYIIRGSIGTGVSYRVGWNSATTYCDTYCWGVSAGGPASGAPPPPSGNASQHTRILGENYASCLSQSARTQLHGGWGVGVVLALNSSSYVDAACFDITDFSNCGRSGQITPCETDGQITSDFASIGMSFNNQSTHDTITDIRAHGFAGAGLYGSPGDGFVATDLVILGNSSSGWNGDDNSGQTGVGSMLVQNFNISWNGCSEEYPLVDPLPYFDCTDQGSGGYGDGFGTATVESGAPGWQVHFDNGISSFNTQDGLDALHISGLGSTMTDTRVLAFGNEGNQLKVGGAAATIQNSVIVGNCEAMIVGAPQAPAPFNTMSPIPGTPAGFGNNLFANCRGASTAVVINVTPADPAIFQNNTIYTAGAIGLEVEYASYDIGTTNTLQYDNNVFVGFFNVGDGSNATTIFSSSDLNMLSNPGASWSNNVTYGQRLNWTCPRTDIGEVNGICTDPQLKDETYHFTGFGAMAPLNSSSRVIGAGMFLSSVPLDFTGATRNNPPTIGAYEEPAAVTLITVSPSSASVIQGEATAAYIANCNYSDGTGPTPCTAAWTGTNNHSTVNSVTGVVTGVSVGSDTITATISTIFGTATVTVNPIPPFKLIQGGFIRGVIH